MHAELTLQLSRLVQSEKPDQSQRALSLLRILGSRDALLSACYVERDWTSWAQPFGAGRRSTPPEVLKEAQQLYFRVTGAAYNSVAAPAANRTLGAVGRWNFDASLGGTTVASKVPHLSMTSSRLDARIEITGNTSYTEWTMVFKNGAANASEARAQIELPPGGVVSRLTLWINGEPREAAFGGRSQVRAAYQEVAVQQRRDPVLVTTAGPNRVLMQCFPVPADGGEMKVRVGITAPLQLRSETERGVHLPRMLETNFRPRIHFAHELWMDSDALLSRAGGTPVRTLRVRLSEADLSARSPILVTTTAPAASVTDDPTDPQSVIRQHIERRPISVQAALR
jgi:hypothetical protein